jgi:hypothetical protein
MMYLVRASRSIGHLSEQDVDFDFMLQLQTDAFRMPTLAGEAVALRAGCAASYSKPALRFAGTTRLRQRALLQSLARAAGAPAVGQLEPRAARMYWELSQLRQKMNPRLTVSLRTGEVSYLTATATLQDCNMRMSTAGFSPWHRPKSCQPPFPRSCTRHWQ